MKGKFSLKSEQFSMKEKLKPDADERFFLARFRSEHTTLVIVYVVNRGFLWRFISLRI